MGVWDDDDGDDDGVFVYVVIISYSACMEVSVTD